MVIELPKNPSMWPVGELFFWGHTGMSLDSAKNLQGYGVLSIANYLKKYVLKSEEDFDQEMIDEEL